MGSATRPNRDLCPDRERVRSQAWPARGSLGRLPRAIRGRTRAAGPEVHRRRAAPRERQLGAVEERPVEAAALERVPAIEGDPHGDRRRSAARAAAAAGVTQAPGSGTGVIPVVVSIHGATAEIRAQ